MAIVVVVVVAKKYECHAAWGRARRIGKVRSLVAISGGQESPWALELTSQRRGASISRGE